MLPSYYFGHILFVKCDENKGYRVRVIKTFSTVVIVVWILTALSGCATVAPPAAPTSTVTWDARKTQLSRLQNWQLSGKIAVTTAQDSGSASVDWSQRAQNYTISLYGPLGANGMTLNGSAGRVTMQTSNGQTVSAASAEQLIAQQWGWKLPVSYLKYWVRGLPVPNLPQTSTFDGAHRLLALNQQGFSIQFSSYTTSGSLDLPSRLTINSPSFKSKIVIYKWNTN